MTPAGLSNNHGTRHELSMPSTVIAVETMPAIVRDLSSRAGARRPPRRRACDRQNGVREPSVAESRDHAWTPGGGPRVGEQLGGGRRHGYAQAHGRESAAGVDFIAPATPVSWAAPDARRAASTSAAPADHLQGGAWAARRASPPRCAARRRRSGWRPSESATSSTSRRAAARSQRAGCGGRRCDACARGPRRRRARTPLRRAGGTEVWSSLQTLERDGSWGGKLWLPADDFEVVRGEIHAIIDRMILAPLAIQQQPEALDGRSLVGAAACLFTAATSQRAPRGRRRGPRPRAALPTRRR